MFKQIVIITLALVLGGCLPKPGIYRAEGFLALEEGNFPYQHVAISPKTDDSVKLYLAQALRSKGYTVFLPTAFNKVTDIKPGTHVAIFVCKDAGMTDRGIDAYSRSVSCEAYDLHSELGIYEGIGEFMGMTAAEDYSGALLGALVRFPNIGDSGRVTSNIDLPRGMAARGSDSGLERSSSTDPTVTLLNVYLAASDAQEKVVAIMQPGDTVEQIIHYQVSGVMGEGTVLLKERRSILHNDIRLTDEVYEKRQSAGIYRTALHITLPADAEPGEYVLEAGIIYGTKVVGQRFKFSIAAQ